MSDSELKVTDKRMFTRDGELREESVREAETPAASFVDLVALLAQSVALALDAEAPNPRLARLHIDLLGVLRTKTRGNLEVSEQAALDDVLYRLRMLYVDKTTP